MVELHQQDSALLLPESSAQLPEVTTNTRRSTGTGNAVRLQVIRTIPKGIYSFAPEEGIATILDTYKRAFAQAKQFIYKSSNFESLNASLNIRAVGLHSLGLSLEAPVIYAGE